MQLLTIAIHHNLKLKLNFNMNLIIRLDDTVDFYLVSLIMSFSWFRNKLKDGVDCDR